MGKSTIASVPWDSVILPKLMGGLNCGNLLHRNISLLFKWIWRILHEPEALWRKVISEKYGDFIAHELTIPKQGGQWKNIVSCILKNPVAKEMLKSHIRRVVRNGAATLFWQDLWLGQSPLKNQFPRLFSIAADPKATIASLGSWHGPVWIWNFNWIRPFRPRDENEWSSLQGLMKNIFLSSSSTDSFAWTPHKAGLFSVKSISLELAKSSCNPQARICNWKRVWKGLVPPRIEVFLWQALLGKISTRTKLAHLQIISHEDTECPLCKNAPEDSDHLLLHCPFSRDLWYWWLGVWKVAWTFPKSLMEAFD